MSDEMVDMEAPGVIRALFSALELDLSAHRDGPYNWLIHQGSAWIDLAYHEKTGLIIGEAKLCQIPPKNRTPLYKYLLQENDKLEGLSFSISEEKVTLSLLIYDRQINTQQGIKLLQSLLDKADYYDDILVNQYGGSWIKLTN